MSFWASFGSAASSALGSAVGGSFGSLGDMLTGGYFTRKGQSQQNRYNLYSTGTAHQREVNDLRMAGLNPVLSAIGNGAAVLPVHGVSTPKTDFAGVMQKAVDHGIQTYNARTQRELADNQVNLVKQQQGTEKTQQRLNDALAAKAITDSSLNSAKTQAENVRASIELLKSKYLRDASPQLRDAVINAMLTGSGSSLAGTFYQGALDASGSFTRSFKDVFRNLINAVKSSDPNATQSHSSAKQMKERDEGYEERRQWLENFRKELKND